MVKLMFAKMHKSAAFYINPPSNLKTQSSFMIVIGIICGVIGILVTFLDEMSAYAPKCVNCA